MIAEAPSFSPELFTFLRDLAANNDREWFAANKARYVAGEIVEASHILFAVTPAAPTEAIRRQAEATLKQVLADPARFAELAQAMSRFQASRGANAVEVQQKTENLARKQAEATSCAADYHSSVSSSTLSAMGDQIKTAPPIAQGGGSPFAGQSGHGEVGGHADDAWKEGDKRYSRLVFIGRNLDEAKLKAGFEACAA